MQGVGFRVYGTEGIENFQIETHNKVYSAYQEEIGTVCFLTPAFG